MSAIRITPDGEPVHKLHCQQCPKLSQVSRDLGLIETNARVHAGKFPGHIANVTTTVSTSYTAANV
jgi:hypothetical protein